MAQANITESKRELDAQIVRALCNIAAVAATLILIEQVTIVPVHQQGRGQWL